MIGTPDLPKYQIKILAGDGAVLGTPMRLMAVLVMAGNNDWKIELTNDADGSGTNVLELAGQAEGGQTFFDFTNLNGVLFSSKCYADVTTTGGQFFFWYDTVDV